MIEYVAAGFVAGMLAGMGLLTVLAIYYGKKFLKKEQARIEAAEKKMEKDVAEVKRQNAAAAKLKEAGKIIETQNQIVSAVQQPSANSLHSRHKNRLVGDWKALEEKKQKLFADVLKSGVDPVLSVFDTDTNTTKEMKLSELVGVMKNKPSPFEEDSKDGKKKKNKRSITRKTKNGKTLYLVEDEDDSKTSH